MAENKFNMVVAFSVEVDAEGWDMSYGTGTDHETVCQDVGEYIRGLINESADGNMKALMVTSAVRGGSRQ